MGGGAAFEIILTAILAAVTGGVGAVASMASKARHMTKFKKLGELLVDFAKASKQLASHTKARAKQAAKAAKKSFDDLKTDMDAPVQKGERPRAIEKPRRKRPIKSVEEAKARLAEARKEIIQRRKAGLPEYKPKYSDQELIAMAENGATANERFLVSVQPKDTSPDATLVFQRESKLAPAWTTSFDQLEAAVSDPKLIHQVLGAQSNFDPNKEYVMHIIDRGENLDQYGNNTIVPTWDNLSDASKNHLAKADPDLIDSVMSSECQAEYATKMEEFWSSGGNQYNQREVKRFSSQMSESEKSKFLMRHSIRTEIGANTEFTGNGLTANTASGGGNYGVVETLTMDYNTPPLSQLQSAGTVVTIDLVPIGS
ncbi:hypothetical protein L1F30_11815 [Simiduia sp. 21SJ11W-1]|uniref:hypothetical protein n=1 Tax=Simiduia sp. 21SJ11W-1 TaxID=2909669 RepID=UPI00209F4622|nr:hypothetical protein [Simiduia sp. 21SJ11W-1]UTA46847.1 hypothetical protein L1F30_11815 [Simiduia sp. 21SJ11W-1]